MYKLVSIVLPVYNGERFLAQSIESVLNQTYKNIELIIINDCSTDSSEDIILKYKAQDNRIQYYKNEENLKLPKSLNRGFSFARGEYLTWTSDDNYYDVTALEKMVKFLNNNPKTDMVCCDYYLIEQAENTIIKREVYKGNILLANNIGACFLYRREIACKVGEYNDKLFLVEDYDYWIRIFLNGKIDALHEYLYYYRHHEKSLTTSRKQEIIQSEYNYKLKMLPVYEKSKIATRLKFEFYDLILTRTYDNCQRKKLKRRFILRHPLYCFEKVFLKIRNAIIKVFNFRKG